MTISELILMLKEIKKDHGDIPIKILVSMDRYGDETYSDVEGAEYIPEKKSENSNENTDDYIVLR